MKKIYKVFLIIFLFFLQPCFVSAEGIENDRHQLAMETIVKRIKKQYSIEIIYKDIPNAPWSNIAYRPASQQDYAKLIKFLTILEQEMYKYPLGFFDKIQLRYIILLKRFFYSEKPLEGLYGFNKNAIFLDFYRKGNQELSQRHTIHHEIFHMIDFQAEIKLKKKDSQWETFNLENFQYGQKEKFQRNTKRKYFISRGQKGFITPYAMTSVKEDKAEIFACLMIKSQNKILHQWMQDDDILKNKVSYIKNYVAPFFGKMKIKGSGLEI